MGEEWEYCTVDDAALRSCSVTGTNTCLIEFCNIYLLPCKEGWPNECTDSNTSIQILSNICKHCFTSHRRIIEYQLRHRTPLKPTTIHSHSVSYTCIWQLLVAKKRVELKICSLTACIAIRRTVMSSSALQTGSRLYSYTVYSVSTTITWPTAATTCWTRSSPCCVLFYSDVRCFTLQLFSNNALCVSGW